MMYKQNLHTHTHYCDGLDSPEDVLLEAINKGFMCKSATKSEIQKCKKIRESLGKVTGLDENATVYLNAVTMNVDMLFQNEMPAVVNMMIKNTSSNLKMQINNLRNAIQ